MNDILTGLANRVSLREALHAAIGRADRNRSKLAVMMIDLDRFKPINDRHGHLIGDLVLKAVASRMSRVLRRGEMRARYGGDEFVAVVEYPTRRRDPAHRQPPPDRGAVGADGRSRASTVQIGASVGFAVYPSDATHRRGPDPQGGHRALPRQAGRPRLGATSTIPAWTADIDARAQVEEELRDAIAAGDGSCPTSSRSSTSPPASCAASRC